MTKKIKKVEPYKLAPGLLPDTRRLRAVFPTILQRILDPVRFFAWVEKWRDSQLHGGIKSVDRAGHALRAADMRGLAPGLLAPDYYRLTEADLPKPASHAIEQFLNGLIARSTARVARERVPVAIGVGLAKIAEGLPGWTLKEHASSLADLATSNPTLYRAAMLGDYRTAELQVEAIAGGEHRDRVTRLLAVQRIIWGLADVHRSAARAAKAAKFRIPPFVRPFVSTGSANEMLLILLSGARTIERIFANADATLKYNPAATTIRVHGEAGVALAAARFIGTPIETRLTPNDKQAVLDSRPAIREQARAYETRIEQIRTNPERSNQETVHQFVTEGLSEVAALFVTARRFAEDEDRMLAVIKNPAIARALWDTSRPSWSHSPDSALAVRARRLVAAYRPAILRDFFASDYKTDNIRLAEQAEEDAAAFLRRMSERTDQPADDQVGDIAHVLASRTRRAQQPTAEDVDRRRR